MATIRSCLLLLLLQSSDSIFVTRDGLPDKAYTTEVEEETTLGNCFINNCDEENPCAVAYNSKTHKCLTTSLSPTVLLWGEGLEEVYVWSKPSEDLDIGEWKTMMEVPYAASFFEKEVGEEFHMNNEVAHMNTEKSKV